MLRPPVLAPQPSMNLTQVIPSVPITVKGNRSKFRNTVHSVLNFEDNIISTGPIKNHITTSIDEINVIPSADNTYDHVIVIKLVQNITYRSKTILGNSVKNKVRDLYSAIVIPGFKTDDTPTYEVSYDGSIYTKFSKFVVNNVAKQLNEGHMLTLKLL